MKLYLDTNIIIYGHEAADPLRQDVLKRLLDWCQQSEGKLVTSVLSRLECRVLPLRNQDQPLLAEYDDFFAPGAVEVVPISEDVLELATSLRAQHRFRTPDAIHLASALHVGAAVFMTSDAALERCPGIKVEVVRTAIYSNPPPTSAT